jgi:hypothetical protein
MSVWRLVEHKKVCCLMFLVAIGLKTHNVLYKVFLNKSFGECLSYVNSFVKSYCTYSVFMVYFNVSIINFNVLESI